ncbi:MAG TPA: hypothetical protein VG387_04830 [Rhizomicrobium sp.]|jgi:hypothetical protein|nr:hypothetical protein [Rhizomicrobium sp.]
MNHSFDRMLVRLLAKLKTINALFPKLSAAERDRLLSTAASFCEELWDKMDKEGIDPQPYIEILGDIEGQIQTLKLKSAIGLGTRSVAGRLFRAFASVINLASSIVGIGPIFSSVSRQIKLLEYDDES